MKKGLWHRWIVAGIVILALSLLPVCTQAAEVIYLSDSAGNDVGTYLFRVEFDSFTGKAHLSLLPNGLVPFNQVDALACTPDGAKIYAVDKYGDTGHPGTGKLGYYEVGNATWHEIDYVKHSRRIVPGIVLAAFSPDGTLYVASEYTDSLYTVNTNTAAAKRIGKVRCAATGAVVNLSGADIVFDAFGTFYLWVNRPCSGAPRGLYVLTLPGVTPGTVQATFIGTCASPAHFTGLAIRGNGTGDLVGSTFGSELIVLDKTCGAAVETFTMHKEGICYGCQYGDMTAGPLTFCSRTIGYWKNHPWNGLATSVCGVAVDESLGKMILMDARGNNFSMLFAQLIAAKLNMGGFTGNALIEEAETWLCGQDVVTGGDTLDYNRTFVSKMQKSEAAGYSESLDEFNNEYGCE